MVTARTYRAYITVDGEKLPEYKVEYEDDNNTVRCWVPSEYGKEFVVHWVDMAKIVETAGYVYVDGEHCGGRFIRPEDRDGHVHLESRPLSANSTASFRFGAMQLTDEEYDVESAEVTNALGTIKVLIKEGTIGESYQHEYRDVSQKPVNERMKKAGGHRVVLGTQKSAPQTWKQFFPSKTEPVTFIFQYRPKDLLRAMEIIPDRAAHRQEPQRERPVSSRSGRNVRVKKEAESRASSVRGSSEEVEETIKEEEDVERATSGSSQSRRKRSVTPVTVSAPKRGTKRKIEVIDLTQSDDESEGEGSSSSGSTAVASSSKRPTKRVKIEPEERRYSSIGRRSRPVAPVEVIDLTV